MDGVLIHSTAQHAAAFAETLAPLGIYDFDYSRFAGQRTPDVFRTVLAEHSLPIEPEQIATLSEAKSSLARQKIAQGDALAPHCAQLLTWLSSHYRLALASSGSRQSVAAFLALSGTEPLFESILTGDDVEHAKPHPEIYLRSFEKLGLLPADCIVVEDAVSGVQAAVQAGASVIGIASPGNEAALLEAGASSVLHTLTGLTHLLDSHSSMNINPGNWQPLAAPSIHPDQWTVVIPAAGRGTRLGFDLPKILFPVAGKTILAWLIERFRPNASRFVFVLSPDGAPHVLPHLEALLPGAFEIVIQPVPTGMGDAVERGLAAVNTPSVAIVWGDQVNLRADSVAAVMRLHQGPLQPLASIPTVKTSPPYIHFSRDSSGAIHGLLQAREGDHMPAEGESDTGFFCFATQPLAALLTELRASGLATGHLTGEFNFLPVIPLAAALPRGVITPSLVSPEETIGINSRADAERVQSFLLSQSNHAN